MAGHAVAVLIVTPQGIPFVLDPRKPAPVFWKLPGGRSKEDVPETAEDCAVREVAEELGVFLSGSDLKIVYSEDRGNHTFTLFRADLTALPQMKSKGDEGEEIRVFSPREILANQKFFPNHRRVVGKILAALP